MSKPIIGIAANEINDAGEILHSLPISYTPAGYVKGIQLAGGLPLMIPIGHPQDAETYIQQIDKLILAGGQHVSPKFYGGSLIGESNWYHVQRDEFELALIEAALLADKPIFAVCRGMQLLNVALGGSVAGGIATSHMQAPTPKEISTHQITTEKDTWLREIYGEISHVNSFHEQAIHHLATDFSLAAVSPDGVIEGIESKKRQLLGVQWHPDFSYTHSKKEQAIFQFAVADL